MNKLLKICALGDLRDTEPTRVVGESHPPLAVYRLTDGIFITDDTCTHGSASLAEGYLEGDVIECPFHGGAFDIRTGEPTAFPCAEALRTYAAIIQDGFVYIEPETLD
ncbi:MAG: ethylbenzene dioxygenase ferredoxin subunit [Gammaproteobacteria bacterium]|jgi:ethylbenzene dioxygenase ferredoxin subunit